MKVLGVHPGPLMYTKIFLRLEPLGLELVAAAARASGHEVRLIDLQVETHDAFARLVAAWRPDVIAFSCNYLANVPEIVDLAKRAKTLVPRAVICVGGHSASFIAPAIIEHGAASIEFSRGCPWDCSFCSAWTFYGRSYRLVSLERVIEDLSRIREPGIFIVDDVAFIHERHGMELGEAVVRAGIDKHYYLETRGDVLLRNKEVFRLWKRLGLAYMFLGLEAIDEEGLLKYRKRVP